MDKTVADLASAVDGIDDGMALMIGGSGGSGAPIRPGGSVTAGKASGFNDGAAALIVASEAAIKKHGLTPLARIVGGASAGVPPRIMGFGPSPASRRLRARYGLIPDASHVNRNGDAIALGHPLGMSGARIVGAAALELSLTGAATALATMCIGVGQGIAVALERV